MRYRLEIYEIDRPGGSDCLVSFSSKTPFMAFTIGDTIIPFPSDTSEEYTIEKITHIVWNSQDSVK